MRATIILVAFLASACGGDGGSVKKQERGGGAAKAADGKGAAPKGSAAKKGPAKKAKIEPLMVYPKVPDEDRIVFTKDHFTPDAEGNRNRDPFRSYLVQPGTAQTTAATQQQEEEDPCEKHWVAQQYGMRDLRLVGIINRGNRGYAMFVDSQRFGHIAYRGTCLSKDRVRVRDIGADCVTLLVQAEAPPGGGPAPPPHEEPRCVNTELQITPAQEEQTGEEQ